MSVREQLHEIPAQLVELGWRQEQLALQIEIEAAELPGGAAEAAELLGEALLIEATAARRLEWVAGADAPGTTAEPGRRLQLQTQRLTGPAADTQCERLATLRCVAGSQALQAFLELRITGEPAGAAGA